MLNHGNWQETEDRMRLNAELLSKQFKGMGFALIVFDFNKPGISNYVSNAKREDMIKALRETADRLEKNQDIPPIQGEA